MQIQYSLLENILMIEVLLVFLIVIATFILKYYNYRQYLKNKRVEMQIERYLIESLEHYNDQIIIQTPNSWKRLDIILPLILTLDNNIKDSNWPALKTSFFKFVVLPIARKHAYHKRWINRLLAGQAFEQHMEDEDEAHVAHLVMDKVPIIHLQGITDAIKFNSKLLINLFITRMSEQRRLNQSVYLKIFESAKDKVDQFIYERLQSEDKPYVRASCYKLLLTLPRPDNHYDTTNDVNSSVLELQITAIRFTVYQYKENSIPLLLDLLSDPVWQVRSTSLQLLNQMKAVQTIAQVAQCLNDPIWWVRINAATALKSFGEPGINILEAQDPSIDRYAYETAMHVLNKPVL